MDITYTDFKKISAGLATMLTAFIMIFLLTACAGKGNYGSMAFDRGLDDQFTSYQVLSGYYYYITGGYNAPAAILAVRKDYHLENDAGLWVPVPDVTPDKMKTWIDNLSGDMNFWKEKPFLAYYILDPEGKKVGAWYSAANKTTPVRFLGDNRIRVYGPHLTPTFGGENEKQSSKHK